MGGGREEKEGGGKAMTLEGLDPGPEGVWGKVNRVEVDFAVVKRGPESLALPSLERVSARQVLWLLAGADGILVGGPRLARRRAAVEGLYARSLQRAVAGSTGRQLQNERSRTVTGTQSEGHAERGTPPLRRLAPSHSVPLSLNRSLRRHHRRSSTSPLSSPPSTVPPQSRRARPARPLLAGDSPAQHPRQDRRRRGEIAPVQGRGRPRIARECVFSGSSKRTRRSSTERRRRRLTSPIPTRRPQPPCTRRAIRRSCARSDTSSSTRLTSAARLRKKGRAPSE